MKCPKCSKKMEKRGAAEVCKKCGYTSLAKISRGDHISATRCVYVTEKKDYVAPVRKNTASRLFALAVIALCVLAFTVFPYYIIEASGVALAKNGIALVTELFKSTGRMFGFVPAFTVKGTLGMLYNVAIYVFLLCSVLAAIISVFAIFSRKSAPRRVRRALFFLGIGALFYSVMFIVTTHSVYPDLKMSANSLFAWLPFVVDVCSLAIGIGCLLLSFFFLIFRRKNK